jgi:Tol biopolymer transport system component
MTYAATSQTQSLHKIGFDPETMSVVGEPGAMARGIPGKEFPQPSPDGEWLVFASTGMREDIYVIRTDGTGLRQLTNDPHRDRRPQWSPDGSRIAFYSNRVGGYEIWAISADGGSLEQLTDTPGRTIHYPVWSPDGKKMIYSSRGSSGFQFDLDKAWDQQTPEELPLFNDKGDDFVPFTWSPDGKWLAGYIRSSSGVRGGLCLFDPDTHEYRRLTDFGLFPEWFNDSKRILFQAADRSVTTHLYQQDYKLFVLDIESGDVREVHRVAEATIGPPTLSSDNRSLYYVLERLEADIWILEDR